MKIIARVGNTSNNELYGLLIKRDTVSTIRVYIENGNATDVYLCATRSDFVENKRTGEADDTAKANGQELIDSGLILARVGAGAWTNICGWSNKMQIGPVAEQAYVDVQLKSDLATAETTGTAYIGLAFRIAGTEASDTPIDPTTGAVVSGGYFSELNQSYAYISAGLLRAANNATITYSTFDGYWRIRNNAGNLGAFAYSGNINQLPARGWGWINRRTELPNLIATGA
jgi:hypothetical protein